MFPLILMAAYNTNGTTQAIDVPHIDFLHPAIFSLYIFGTFGGATVQLQASYDGVNYVNVPGASTSTATVLTVTINAVKMRCVVSGGTAASITAALM